MAACSLRAGKFYAMICGCGLGYSARGGPFNPDQTPNSYLQVFRDIAA